MRGPDGAELGHQPAADVGLRKRLSEADEARGRAGAPPASFPPSFTLALSHMHTPYL